MRAEGGLSAVLCPPAPGPLGPSDAGVSAHGAPSTALALLAVGLRRRRSACTTSRTTLQTVLARLLLSAISTTSREAQDSPTTSRSNPRHQVSHSGGCRRSGQRTGRVGDQFRRESRPAAGSPCLPSSPSSPPPGACWGWLVTGWLASSAARQCASTGGGWSQSPGRVPDGAAAVCTDRRPAAGWPAN